MTAILVTDLTTNTLEGTGVFDVLMRANKAHLESEFKQNRIKGAEYATVYLGSLESVMRTSLDFLLQSRRVALEAQLMEQQVILAQVAVTKAEVELAILNANLARMPSELLLLTAQTGQATQQTANLVLEALNIPKQGLVLDGQKCKLDAEFDLLVTQKIKSLSEVELLTLKSATEKAQTLALGVDADSVLGKQKALYQAQSDGFKRDAEQKASKILIDTWSLRRSTDAASAPADGNNLLYDGSIKQVVTKLLSGVGA